MYSIDKSDYKKILLDFHKQIEEAKSIFENARTKIDTQKIHNILYLGMGGSAIVGDLLFDVFFDELKIPINVVRSYYAPSYCSEHTLIIVSSYSGNTEETLSALQQATKKGAQVVAITSGGKLSGMAKDNNWNLVSVPEGLPPRQALGYMFFPLYHLFGKFGLIENYNENLHNLAKFVSETARHNDYPGRGGKVLAKELARTIQNRIPIFYSTAPYLSTVSRRWQNQIQENAKSPAFANILPEMNHNEIVGWEIENIDLKSLIVIFLENQEAHPRIKKRIELSKKIIKERGVEVVDIYANGSCYMEKVFSLIVLGDWVSYYLALAYEKDPSEIKNIDYLKKEMSVLTEK